MSYPPPTPSQFTHTLKPRWCELVHVRDVEVVPKDDGAQHHAIRAVGGTCEVGVTANGMHEVQWLWVNKTLVRATKIVDPSKTKKGHFLAGNQSTKWSVEQLNHVLKCMWNIVPETGCCVISHKGIHYRRNLTHPVTGKLGEAHEIQLIGHIHDSIPVRLAMLAGEITT